MTEENIPQLNISNASVIFMTLTIMPLIFLGLLYALQSVGGEIMEDTTNIFPILTYVLYAMILFNLIIAQYVILPRARQIEGSQRFGFYLVALVLSEAISIYGLLIGLLQLFASTGIIEWNFILPFFVISIGYSYLLYASEFRPWLARMKEEQEMKGYSA